MTIGIKGDAIGENVDIVQVGIEPDSASIGVGRLDRAAVQIDDISSGVAFVDRSNEQRSVAVEGDGSVSGSFAVAEGESVSPTAP